MSQAFVRESDDMWLHDVPPTLNALLVFLTQENGGIRVYELKNYIDNAGQQVHEMSNGMSYSKDEQGRWQIVV